MASLIERLIESERTRFSANEYRGLADASAFTLVEGDIPVLVSAPHAVTHMREGRIKASEDFTGPIALEVASMTGAHAIVATRFNEADPNYDSLEKSAYKQALVDCVLRHGVKLVLDIHGMMAASSAIIAVGTGDGANVSSWPEAAKLAESIIEERLGPFARKHGKEIAFDGRLGLYTRKHGKEIAFEGRYAARGANTVSSTVARECGVAALQVELSTILRFPGGPAGHKPAGEKNPFPGSALEHELSARANPDPAAVEATIDALASIIAACL